MSTVEIRADLMDRISKLDDRFLKAVHLMVVSYQDADPIEGYDLEGNPLRASELMDKYEAGITAVKEGDFITIDELREKTKQWLSSTK